MRDAGEYKLAAEFLHSVPILYSVAQAVHDKLRHFQVQVGDCVEQCVLDDIVQVSSSVIRSEHSAVV
jgi:hypothetical protein